jgi:hypothetical protein
VRKSNDLRALKRSGANGLGGGQRPVEPKGNAIIITKQASGTAKIDPLMAAFNAIAWMAAIPVSATEHILDLM